MSPFLVGMLLLLVFQCAGEVASRLLGLPIPGPVLGMIGLLVVLRMRGPVPAPVAAAAEALARHLSLLFVPAGVGVMLYLGQLRGESIAVTMALLFSTIAAIAAAAVTFASLADRADRNGEPKHDR